MGHQTDVLHRYGLRRNPFGDDFPPEDAFLTEQRHQLLDKLNHLSRYSQFVLVVSGEHGMGKSTFLSQILPASDPVVRPAVLRLQHETGPAQLVASLLQAARIEVEGEPDFEGQVQAIQQHAQMLRDLNRMMLILIDDAELLSDAALDVLFTRVMQTPDASASPHIILFGQPDLLQRLASPRLQTVLSGRSHHAALAALNLDETEAYIRHRMGLAGMRGELPFSAEHYQRIHQVSRGIPAQINRVAQQLLFEQPVQTTGLRMQLPWMHIAAGSVLAATIVLALLLNDGSSEADAVPSAGPVTKQLEIKLPESVVQQQQQAAVAAGAVAPLPEQRVLTLSERLAIQEAKLGVAPEPGLTEPLPEPAGEDVSPISEAPPVAPLAQPAPVASAQPATPVQAEPTKPAAKPEAKVESKVPVVERSSVAVSGNSHPLKREAMVMGWRGNGYTLQMLGARSAQNAIDFIKANGSLSDFAFFETTYKGQPWFVVVYGEYASRESAQAAVSRLPAALQQQKPWPRSIKGVQDEIRNKR